MKPKKILIVEDDPKYRQNLAASLGSEYPVLEADSYQNALEVINEEWPSIGLAFLDLRLNEDEAQNEDGLKLGKLLKDKSLQIGVYILTNEDSLSVARRAMQQYNLDDYYLKTDLDGEAIRNKVTQALGFTSIFLSYAPEQRFFADCLEIVLNNNGFKLTNRKRRLSESSTDLQTIISSIDQSNVLLALLTEDWEQYSLTPKIIQLAQEKGLRFIALKLQPNINITLDHYSDFSEDQTIDFSRIYRQVNTYQAPDVAQHNLQRVLKDQLLLHLEGEHVTIIQRFSQQCQSLRTLLLS